MKLFSLILLNVFINNSYAQENELKLYKNWIVYNIEMVDGSKLIDRYLTDSSFVRFSISEGNLGINSNPIYELNESNLSYELTDNYIKFSETAAYIIEKIEPDTLVLREQIDGFKNDKLMRLYFVSERLMFYNEMVKNGNSKNLVANQYFTPTLKTPLEYVLNTKFNKHYNYKLSGTIVINIKEQKIKTTILNSSTSNFNKINRVALIINDSYDLWYLDNFSEYEVIEIPFILRDRHNRSVIGIDMKYFTTSIDQFNVSTGVHSRRFVQSDSYYNFALEVYNQKKYTRAIKNLTKSLRYNPINIDALYKRAAIYYMIENNKKACSDWKTLFDLGQIQGIRLYENHCKTNI